MKKIISFSVWGDLPLYTVGAIANAKLAKDIYPGWICRYYIHKPSVPPWVINQLVQLSNVEIVYYEDNVGWGGMLYRFYPATEDDVDVMISRDADSRLSAREKACVDDWLLSDKNLHVIRDTCVHQSQMMGGLWGTRNRYLKWIRPLIDDLLLKLRDGQAIKGCDQEFLNNKIYLYAVGEVDQSGHQISTMTNHNQIISHDDIAFGCVRFANNVRLPHVNEEMRGTPIPRKYGHRYHACVHCGLRHDNSYIGKSESLSDAEVKYLNLPIQEIQERKMILEYYNKYLTKQYKYGLSPVQHEHGSEKIS